MSPALQPAQNGQGPNGRASTRQSSQRQCCQTRGGPSISVQQLLISEEAAKEVGLEKSTFVTMVGLLCLHAEERKGQHGGSPSKYYSPVTLDLVRQFLERCRKDGGEAVLLSIKEVKSCH